VPSKGRLSDASLQLLRRAGIRVETGGARRLIAPAWSGRLRVLFVRAEDVPEFVEDGVADVGITGHDLVAESGKRVEELLDLGFGACRLVVAVPKRHGARRLADLDADVTVATSFPNLTRAHFERAGMEPRIVPVSGSTEITPHLGVADVITDLTASGSTLAMNELVEIDEVLASTARLVANGAARKDARKAALIDEVVFALNTVVSAHGKRYLMMDVPADRLEEVRRIVPGIAGPTVMDVAGDPGMKAVHVVVDEETVYEKMRQLKALGAKGILVVPIDRMVA
jgi:ATP phosphoribosyltransferase